MSGDEKCHLMPCLVTQGTRESRKRRPGMACEKNRYTATSKNRRAFQGPFLQNASSPLKLARQLLVIAPDTAGSCSSCPTKGDLKCVKFNKVLP